MNELRDRIRRAWQGRICGCMLGKPVELLSMLDGHGALTAHLAAAGAQPLRGYIRHVPHRRVEADWCAERLTAAVPDDDINYSVLALMLLEQHGMALSTADVARAWLKLLPAAQTFTAERAAYRTLLARAAERFPEGAAPGFDLEDCAGNDYSDWIGAQIRADVYGWVLPGRPAEAAELARRDAALSHRGNGIHGAMIVAALGSALASMESGAALDAALAQTPADSGAAEAARFGLSLAGDPAGGAAIRDRYGELSPVHTLNNLALVVWALYSHLGDFGAAIGDVVAAGLDTDCNGATVGALWGLQGPAIPDAWTAPWRGRVGLSLAGMQEIPLEVLVDRTVSVAERLAVTSA
jgi:ADP-ribosylglycohydrolase